MEASQPVLQAPIPVQSPSTTPLASPSSEIPGVNGSHVASKKSKRQRLLRGLSMSSPSLYQLSHARSNSGPFHISSSYSYTSLASPASPNAPHGMTPCYSPSVSGMSTAPTSQAGTPFVSGLESYFDGVEYPSTACGAGASGSASVRVSTPLPTCVQAQKPPFDIWSHLPHELKLHVLSFLQPRELVRVSRTSKDFHRWCFDGQMWTSFDASEFYREIPAASLAKIIVAAGPFVKDLNLRGCIQVEQYKRAEIVVNACKNLINATLEGCRNLTRPALHTLLTSNENLAYLNLTGLPAVTNATCKIISESCPSLEALNVSWCQQVDTKGLVSIVRCCSKLKDLRAGEIRGFDNDAMSEAIFRTNNLERLVLAGCVDLTDASLRKMMHGKRAEVDVMTGRAIAPARKLRHLDLSRCNRLTSEGLKHIGHLLPDLEGLSLNSCTLLSNDAFQPLFASSPKLTHLDLEDIPRLSNSLLYSHLAKAKCAAVLEHLCVSHCENIGDTGMIPVLRNCPNLTSVHMDNTGITDLTLCEATTNMLACCSSLAPFPHSTTDDPPAKSPAPIVGLSLVVYDCVGVTWTGVREVLCRNAEPFVPLHVTNTSSPKPAAIYPSEIISLHCFYGWQMTVDEHTKRVLKGDFASAKRLERKWADYMQADHEAGALGGAMRRRQRRARVAQLVHAIEEGGADLGGGEGAGTAAAAAAASTPARRRGRTLGCIVM